jgi:phenylacetate-coenzyme A ligase PaaK-like adenylate-forming protein
METKKHLCCGTWTDDAGLEQYLDKIAEQTAPVLAAPFPLEHLLEICGRMQRELSGGGRLYDRLLEHAAATRGMTDDKARTMLATVIDFLDPAHLRKKLSRELGSETPLAVERPDLKEDHFESWAPLGILVHIAPTNVFTVGILCVIEGLLSGNINILKTSAGQQRLPQLFFEAFLSLDDRNLLKPYIIVVEVPSGNRPLLQRIINTADVVSAWGSEEAIAAIRAMTPQGIRFVAWGHKISFAYFAAECLQDTDAMEKVCRDVCLLDQNGCSSPQDVFVETDDFEELQRFTARFAEVLAEVSAASPRTVPDQAQQAEVTTHVSIARTEEALGLTRVIQAEDFSWAVIADRRGGLGISPLFRTVLIRPLPETDIITRLRPMKRYLQTAALIAPRSRIISLSRLLLAAGCLRIRSAGHMHDGYLGEPHDGVYALPSFMKRISVQLGGRLDSIGTFAAFEQPYVPELGNSPVMTKEDFQAMEVTPQDADLVFKSGGSSGRSTFSCYTYDDYHALMNSCAQGLFSAGLDPRSDRVMNMFAAGHLYGGFLSFFSILERLGAPQYPMGVDEPLDKVSALMVEHNINTLLSLPSLVMKLFAVNKKLFKSSPVITKVFYGGNHFSSGQQQYLQEEFGVQLIRAAAYGSNDAGPLGYQCPHCATNEYHLLADMQVLEVFALDQDRPVPPGTTGRLLFTSKRRRGQRIVRYDVGDTGFLQTGPCDCGRLDPKFTLLGRSSDVFKAGGPFLNYNTFRRHLLEGFGYDAQAQIVLENRGAASRILLRLEPQPDLDPEKVKAFLLKTYRELAISVETLGVGLSVVCLPVEEFDSVTRSGKILHLVDKRNLS